MPRDRTTHMLYSRPDDRRQNDPSDDGWAIVGPMPPKRGNTGRPRVVSLRSVSDRGRYILSTGRPGGAPYPPISTIFHRADNPIVTPACVTYRYIPEPHLKVTRRNTIPRLGTTMRDPPPLHRRRRSV